MATRPFTPTFARGFTLIEVMVVMVIIAILVTAVSLSLKGDRVGEALGEEAKRLSALINLAREEAVMRDMDIGLVLANDGYFFVQRNEMEAESADVEAEYVALADDDMFRSRLLPPGMELSFEPQADARLGRMPVPQTLTPLTPRVLALANDMLMPPGVLVLRHPASPHVERIAIEMDGARGVPQEPGNGVAK